MGGPSATIVEEKVFPSDFIWGTATASYQIEGAFDEAGRGWSIWDAFSHTRGTCTNNDTGDHACDHYHRFREDVALMHAMGLKHYRFSLSWSRLLPTGRLKGGINEAGMTFYSTLIDTLLAAGITPVVTLYHWDLPLALATQWDGWLDTTGQVIQAFTEYATLCFERFGPRVKTWITMNEPWCSAVLGYGSGEHAPGRCCRPETEVYRAGHTLLLAHAHAVACYRATFAATQKGVIAITLNCDWRQPKDAGSSRDIEAAERSLSFHLGWFADPIYTGDYPRVMRDGVGERLPVFSADEAALVRGSNDYFGLNHYGTALVEDVISVEAPVTTTSMWGKENTGGFWADERVSYSDDPTWQKTDMGWNIVPSGFRKLLVYIHKRYAPAGGIVVTENGCAVNEPNVQDAVQDDARIAFYHGYINAMHDAMTLDGALVKGYFAWSFMDNFEWALGYTKRFGMHYVDYKTLARTPKNSSKWFSRVLKRNAVPTVLESPYVV